MNKLMETTAKALQAEIDTLTKKRDDLAASVAEPVATLTAEITDVTRALRALTGKPSKAKASGNGGGGGRGRPAGGGATQLKLLEHVRANPGCKVADIATALDMKSPNYLYRALPKLVESGEIAKNVDGSYTATAVEATASAPEPVTATA